MWLGGLALAAAGLLFGMIPVAVAVVLLAVAAFSRAVGIRAIRLDPPSIWASALLVVAAFPIVAMNSIVVPAAATVRLVPRGSISASPWGIGTSFGALPALLVSVATAALLGIGAFRLGGRLPLRRARGRVIRWPTGWPSPWRDKPPPVPAWSRFLLWGGFLVAVVIAMARP